MYVYEYILYKHYFVGYIKYAYIYIYYKGLNNDITNNIHGRSLSLPKKWKPPKLRSAHWPLCSMSSRNF